MNKILRKITFAGINEIDALRTLAYFSLAILLIGSTFASTVVLYTGIKDHAFELPLCLTSTCVKNFSQIFNAALDIANATGVLLGGVITLGAMSIALLSYLSSNRASALANHLAHISIFSDYIYREIEKKGRLSKSSFDILKWYNLIYSNNEIGLLKVSSTYKEFIAEINNQIAASNSLITKDNKGPYLYKAHQSIIKSILVKAGIQLHALPRLDFHEVEGEVFDLIGVVNKSFCQSLDGFELSKRIYL